MVHATLRLLWLKKAFQAEPLNVSPVPFRSLLTSLTPSSKTGTTAMTQKSWNTLQTWMPPRCPYYNAPSLHPSGVPTSVKQRFFLSCLCGPPDNPRRVWWEVRSVFPCPDWPQHPWAESPPGLFEGWAPGGGTGDGDGPGWPEGRPGWTLLQPGRHDGEGAAAAHWCEFGFPNMWGTYLLLWSLMSSLRLPTFIIREF